MLAKKKAAAAAANDDDEPQIENRENLPKFGLNYI